LVRGTYETMSPSVLRPLVPMTGLLSSSSLQSQTGGTAERCHHLLNPLASARFLARLVSGSRIIRAGERAVKLVSVFFLETLPSSSNRGFSLPPPLRWVVPHRLRCSHSNACFNRSFTRVWHVVKVSTCQSPRIGRERTGFIRHCCTSL
jgi:hypothetical protein